MDTKSIRLVSRAAALALAGVAVVFVLQLRVGRTQPRHGSTAIISYIVVERAATRESARPKPRESLAPFAPPSPPNEGGDPPARLWTYDMHGRIVFDRAEHYQRCLEARAAHHNEADCPEPHDPHPLALRS